MFLQKNPKQIPADLRTKRAPASSFLGAAAPTAVKSLLYGGDMLESVGDTVPMRVNLVCRQQSQVW